MDIAGNFFGSQFCEASQGVFRQQFGDIRANHVPAQDFPVTRIGDQFDEAARFTQTKRLAIGAKGEFRDFDIRVTRFTRLIFAAMIGYFLFMEIPDTFTWIGGMMIFGASLYIAFRERKVKQDTAVVPAAVAEKG